MQTELPARRRKSKASLKKWMLISFVLSTILTLSVLGLFYDFDTKPNDEKIHPYPQVAEVEGKGTLLPILYEGEILSETLLYHNEEYYIPLELFQTLIDERIYYEEESNLVVLPINNEVLTLRNKVLTNEIKGESVELRFPIQQIEDTVYIPYSPFNDMYPMKVEHFLNANIVELVDQTNPRLTAYVIPPHEKEEQEKSAHLRVRSDTTLQSPYISTVKNGDMVYVLNERDQWYYIQTQDGYIGYLAKENARLGEVVTQKWEKKERSYVPWNPIGGKINLTWEHVVSKTPNPENIDPMPGVNVVSPTWFHLKDDEGNLENIADRSYVDWAHSQGYQVWGLVTNDFNPDRTHEVLSSYEKRRNLILQLVYYAEIYHLDGINIDFENVYLKDKENLVQFMRELTPYLHEQGLVVSIDVTIKSNSEMWSLFLDRKALGEIVDYMMVMTYDEHWASSPIAGSVASLPWVERGLQGVLEEVPNEKVLLGVPFYTRIWTEEDDGDGHIEVSSSAYSMGRVQRWIEEHAVEVVYDENTGQHYGEYYDQSEEIRYKVWLEDDTSMKQRVDLVHKYDLAGIASWRRGFEEPSIWNTIKEGLEKNLHEE